MLLVFLTAEHFTDLLYNGFTLAKCRIKKSSVLKQGELGGGAFLHSKIQNILYFVFRG